MLRNFLPAPVVDIFVPIALVLVALYVVKTYLLPPLRSKLEELALIAKSSKHENAKQPHWAQARSSCWGTRSPPL